VISDSSRFMFSPCAELSITGITEYKYYEKFGSAYTDS
jgi:hypothetical protein